MDTKQREAHKFLDEHKVGVLSTVTEDGKPWGSTIYYVVSDSNLNVYFLTHASSNKYRNLVANSAVALTVFDDYQQTTVQIAGTIDELEIGEEHDIVFRKISHLHPPGQFAWNPPVSKIHDGEVVLLKITPKAMRLSSYKADEHGESHIVDVL